MFIGVPGSGIMPNIFILADNSISMRTVIYHPNYNPNLFYNYTNPTDPSSTSLTLELGKKPDGINPIFPTSNGGPSLPANITVNICGNKGAFVLDSDYEARFVSQNKNNPRRWNITVLSGSWTAANVVGQTVEWGCTSIPNSCTGSTTITAVSGTAPNLVVTVNPRVNPPANSRIYINPHWVLSSASPNTATIIEAPADCNSAGFTTTIHSNVQLYGYRDPSNTAVFPSVLYDLNYLYWLAFHASANDVLEVSHWATTGAFKHDSTGTHINAGYYRMQVAKDVLKDVITELWTKDDAYNFGLGCFEDTSAGVRIMNNLQNATNLTGALNTFKVKIDGMVPRTMTPLAEALADIWAYFKCGQSCSNYMPESETNNGGCGENNGVTGVPEVACPIRNFCQKNYVIILTDGRSTSDDFSDSKYYGSIFRTPVADWGDGDNHDPASYNLVQPSTFDPEYCPNETCWKPSSSGTDFLDDVAWYMYHNDIFPDNIRPDMPDMQVVETFTIGFSIENDLLKDTAKNGNGEFYTASDYGALKTALTSAITNIMLRNFAFASYTAPKRVTTAVGEGATFIGYFMPSSKEIWDGHLQSYTMYNKWFADSDNNGVLDSTELAATPYELQTTCQYITGKKCLQTVSMAATPNWDAADKLASLSIARKLYFLDYSSGTPIPSIFSDANIDTLQGPFGFDLPDDNPMATDPLLYHNQALSIVSGISDKLHFGDVFHSDVVYVGAPLKGKIYLQNYNPTPECDLSDVDGSGNPQDPNCYQKFRLDHANRRKVLYVGTNTGIVHMIDANTPDSGDPYAAEGGNEIWGFIPDEVLPSLKTIIIDPPKEFTYTTDGRMTADDIYCQGVASNPWKTILTFGLKDGGQSYYALDITNVQNTPTFLWKFKDAEYSANSWSKPIIGKILFSDGTSSYDRWVVIVSAGRAFNNENIADSKGKAVFVLDAATGDVIWMIGYNSVNGADDLTSTSEMEVNKFAYVNPSGRPNGQKHLTKDPAFNYCIPSAITAIDRDNNGYIDSIYCGNVAGHLFKIDLGNPNPTNWKIYSAYRTNLTANIAEGTITAITLGTPANSYKITISAGSFGVGYNVMGLTSKAMGFITEITGNNPNQYEYTIQETSAESLQLNERIVIRPYDPIFLAPAVYTDMCNNYWVNFGTGCRLRSRTNPTSGKFISIRDGAATPTALTIANLVTLTFSSVTDTFSGSTNLKVTDKWGWYFNFPDTANHEKLFDPDPIVLPDINFLPHIYFNTYQYNTSVAPSTDCNAPSAGSMHFYEITIDYCGTGTASGYREDGRISGGGMMEGSEFIMIEGTSDVGSVDLPGLGGSPKLLPKPFPYTGGLLFWKEKKR
ncbi:MAG: hypothetical protein ABII93_00870 [Chrysiogenia bacterium]